MRKVLMACLGYLGQALFILLVLGAIAFISLPVLGLIWRSIASQAWTIPLDERVGQSILLTFKTTAYSMLLILLFGTPLAYALGRRNFPGRRLINVLIELPIVLPPAVAGLGLLMAFGRRGMLGPTLEDVGLRIAFTQIAVILAQTFVAMPFYIRAAQLGFQNVDPEVESAALVDGADAFQRFVFVTFPLSRRALLSGLLMSWARALGEFGATILFAGSLPGRTQTMTLLIYNIFEQNISAAVWTALLLIAIAVVVIIVVQILERSSASPER
jgi:molybdate transport system permease protein